jgi:hypothetical protein
MVAALLLALGWWILFANVFGPNDRVTSAVVLQRVLLAVVLIATGCGVLAHDVIKALD